MLKLVTICKFTTFGKKVKNNDLRIYLDDQEWDFP